MTWACTFCTFINVEKRKTCEMCEQAKPMSPAQKAKLQLHETTCLICTEDMEDEYAILSGCVHNFHYQCIFKWSKTANTCPSCRQRFTSIKKVAKHGLRTPNVTYTKKIRRRIQRWQPSPDTPPQPQLQRPRRARRTQARRDQPGPQPQPLSQAIERARAPQTRDTSRARRAAARNRRATRNTSEPTQPTFLQDVISVYDSEPEDPDWTLQSDHQEDTRVRRAPSTAQTSRRRNARSSNPFAIAASSSTGVEASEPARVNNRRAPRSRPRRSKSKWIKSNRSGRWVKGARTGNSSLFQDMVAALREEEQAAARADTPEEEPAQSDAHTNAVSSHAQRATSALDDLGALLADSLPSPPHSSPSNALSTAVCDSGSASPASPEPPQPRSSLWRRLESRLLRPADTTVPVVKPKAARRQRAPLENIPINAATV